MELVRQKQIYYSRCLIDKPFLVCVYNGDFFMRSWPQVFESSLNTVPIIISAQPTTFLELPDLMILRQIHLISSQSTDPIFFFWGSVALMKMLKEPTSVHMDCRLGVLDGEFSLCGTLKHRNWSWVNIQLAHTKPVFSWAPPPPPLLASEHVYCPNGLFTALVVYVPLS